MMRRALMWLNLYGREAVQHNLKNGLKTQKMHFLPVFELRVKGLSMGIKPVNRNRLPIVLRNEK